MATLVIPHSLARLFPGMPRTAETQGRTVAEVIDGLNRDFPGVRDRVCDVGPRIRRHITIFVDSELATLQTTVSPTSEVLVIPAVSGG